MVLYDYVPLFLMAFFAVVLAVIMVWGSALFGPNRYSEVKGEPYESGIKPFGPARVRFDVKFYLIAVLFILFDIEIIFLYPWAVVFRSLLPLGTFIYTEMIIFIGILGVGYVYLWKKGAFEWD